MIAEPLCVLLLGYGGANNTGSEIRILTIIEDVRAALGPRVMITVASVNPEKTRQFLSESEFLRIAKLPYVFPLAIWRLTRTHHLTLLVEGSTFTDTWSSALLYAFLWAAWCSRRHGRKCIAYAVDAGQMHPLHRLLTRSVCHGMDLLITRTEAARECLIELGVTRDIAVTTDTAFAFQTPALSSYPNESGKMIVGLAPVEFYQWPVRVRLWGAAEQCYHWPYYYSWDRQRATASASLLDAWTRLANHAIRQRRARVLLIAMEELDRGICERIRQAIDPDLRSSLETIYSGDLTPGEIVVRLRRLDLLITSRYHACVLSMAGAVPQGALYHDERLISIYHELGLAQFAIPHDRPALGPALIDLFERIVTQSARFREEIADHHRSVFLPRCRRNRALLGEWAAGTFPGVPASEVA